jgi:hypothetical protein
LVYLQFSSVRYLKKFRDTLPPRRVVILLEPNILMSEFTEKEIELAETFSACPVATEMTPSL